MPLDIDPTAKHTRAQEVDAKRAGGRRVSLAVSSETPVRRDCGDEILSHEAGAIDLTFFGSGRAPLLLDHDTREQIGVVEKAWLDND